MHDAPPPPAPPPPGAPPGQQVPFGNFAQPAVDQYGNPQGGFPSQQQHGGFPQQQQQGNFPAGRTEGYHDPHHQGGGGGWDQGYQQQDHQQHHNRGGFGGHQRGSNASDPRGYHGNKHGQQHWEQPHGGGGGGSGHHHDTNTHHKGESSGRYGSSHGSTHHRNESSKGGDDYHSRSHHHHGDHSRHGRERKDSYKDRHKSRHSMSRDGSRESSRSDRSQSPPPPAPPPPPPPPREIAKPSSIAAPASKEPKKDKKDGGKDDEESTSLDLRIEQLLNQSKMSFSFDLESSLNSSTGSGGTAPAAAATRRDSIGSDSKEAVAETQQKDIPGGDLYEEFSDEDFEVDQELEDRGGGERLGGRRDDFNRDSQRGSHRGRGNQHRGRDYRDDGRDRGNKFSPDRGREDHRDRHHRDKDHRGSKHKHKSRHRWKEERHHSSERRSGGRGKYARDELDNSDGEYGGEYRQKDKYSDRGYSRRDRKSSLDRDESMDSYRSERDDQDLPRHANSKNDATPTEDEVQIVDEEEEVSTSSLVSKGIASLRQSGGGKDSPYGAISSASPAMEVSIIGTDSQGSTPLTAEPSTSGSLQDGMMVSRFYLSKSNNFFKRGRAAGWLCHCNHVMVQSILFIFLYESIRQG